MAPNQGLFGKRPFVIPPALAFAALVFGAGRVQAEQLIGLTTTGNLVTFDSATPGTTGSSVSVNGLPGGATLLGIDRRPANGLLYGLGSNSRIYTLNTTTGLATAVIPTAFAPALTGTAFGFDFNPVPDRIRVVSTDTTNFRLNPNDGTLAGTDTPLGYAAGDSGAGMTPRVVGSAYSNNFNGTAVTTLFGIDSNRDVLVRQGGPDSMPSPNGGVLTTIGAGLGFNTADLVGFDISGETGAATLVGTIGTGQTFTSLAAAIPEPSGLGLLGIGLAAIAAKRRRRA